MLRLYPGVHFAAPDYADLAETCKSLLWDTAAQILHAGTDVVLDWNQWSRERRAIWSGKAAGAGFDVVVHHLQTPLATAVVRARRRARNGEPGLAPG